jgi:hypothetical protein
MEVVIQHRHAALESLPSVDHGLEWEVVKHCELAGIHLEIEARSGLVMASSREVAQDFSVLEDVVLSGPGVPPPQLQPRCEAGRNGARR